MGDGSEDTGGHGVEGAGSEAGGLESGSLLAGVGRRERKPTPARGDGTPAALSSAPVVEPGPASDPGPVLTPGPIWEAGPRALEAQLLDDLGQALDEARRAGAWARPIRVLVPSGSLRDHLTRALVARAGRALLGLRVQTMESAVAEVIASGEATLGPPALFGARVREVSGRDAVLSRTLSGLDDGFGAVVGVVDDLLDAGFMGAHAEVLAERLDELGGGAAQARAAALLRVASTVEAQLADGTLGHRSARLAMASEQVHASPECWPTQALFLHGFADATGAQLDFLEALMRAFPSRIYLDASRLGAFGARLRTRLAPGAAPPLSASPAHVASVEVHRDPEAEARAAALWARERLAAGAVPERVAIVVRDLESHRLALRRQLRRTGVPFSGAGEAGGAGRDAARVQSLLTLLRDGGRMPYERWLTLHPELVASPSRLADARDAGHVLGWVALADAANAPAVRAAVPLPARLGLEANEPGVVARRQLAARDAEGWASRARASLAAWHAWSARCGFDEARHRLETIWEAVGWSHDEPLRVALEAALPTPVSVGPSKVETADWIRLLERSFSEVGFEALGGAGGGVQVLGVMEARARSFDALRVLGLNRGQFPRAIQEDALLSDAVRAALRVVLPDLPIKREGHDEERFLFEQLLGAASQVVLSYAEVRADGRPASVSPLLERVISEQRGAPSALEAGAPPPHVDWLAALHARTTRERRALGLPALSDAALRGRAAAIAALEFRGPRRQTAELPASLGAVGPAVLAEDPRQDAPFVTFLEQLAKCPWQAFLRRVLRLEPVPDARGTLPGGRDARLLGNVVHRTLEVSCAPDAATSWPTSVDRKVLHESARRELQRAGVALPGYERALAARAAAFVDVARRLDAGDPALVRAVEPERTAEVPVGDATRTLRFRADREDALSTSDGSSEAPRVRFTDWKTGRAPAQQTRAESRREEHRRRLLRGELLQAHAYAQHGEGRFVYLDPDLDDALRVLAAEPEGAQREAFEQSVATLFGAFERGVFFPRLRLPDRDEEPGACRFCDYKQACVRGDSGARAQLQRWAEASGSTEGAALWALAAADRT